MLDSDQNGVLSDDERDADADGLGNWDEIRGPHDRDWWVAQHDGKNEPRESKYPGIDYLDMEDTAPAYNAHVVAWTTWTATACSTGPTTTTTTG